MAVRIESQAEPIPGYTLVERLGGGGFGEVWKAVAPGGLHKAIKFVYGELDATGDDAQRAEQELRSIKRVQSVRHPYILSLERYDIVDGQLMIVMELADRNLWDRFKECRALGLPGIPRDELLSYMDEAAEALDLMNSQYGLMHLDIKPQNLFLVHNHIKIADFGLVKALEGMVASVTGGVTPVYAAPETFDQWVSRYSDQYSLAIVYQEMLTGRRPFNGSNVRQLVMQHLQGTPDLSSLAEDDRPIVARALAKNPDERYPSCAEFVRELRAVGNSSQTPPAAETGLLTPPSADSTQVVSVLAEAREPAPPEPVRAAPLTPVRSGPGTRTPSAAADAPDAPHATDWVRQPRPTASATTVPPRTAEGTGLLVPALVVGVGGLGAAVLRNLREALTAQVGPRDLLPHLRLLYLDTDADALKAAGRTAGLAGLTGGEVVPVRLQRPSHYLKPRDGRPEVASWLDPQMLYRIPRNQQTAGCRALGRLAFCDNFRLLAHTLRAELEVCLGPEALNEAARQTGLGVRATQPRVYVVAGLGGGTGGGMFLDLAYLVRDLLHKAGLAHPDVVGILLLPSSESPNRPLGLGNAYAALTELAHYHRAGFAARYLERDGTIVGQGPPFDRCVVLPLGAEDDAVATQGVVAQAAELLTRELVTPWGRVVDAARRREPSDLEPTCHSVGMYKFAFPRRELVVRVARRLCQALVKRWMNKDGAALRPAAQDWVREQWPRDEYGPETFIERLQADVEEALGDAPEALFAEAVRPVAGLPRPDSGSILDALARLEKHVGRPGEEASSGPPPEFYEPLRDAAERVVDTWGARLMELVVQLVESPEFRLAGAEEAIRCLVGMLEEMLAHQEPLARELALRAADAHARILHLVGLLSQPVPPKGRPLPTTADAVELLRAFPKWRYQGLILQQVARGLVSLRGLLSDQLREINFCRNRLGELLRTFSDGHLGSERRSGPTSRRAREAAPPAEPVAGGCPGRVLLPRGSASLESAVEMVMKEVTTEQLTALDERVQAMIQRQFTALVHVCLAPSNMLRALEVAMQQEAENEARVSLSWSDATEVFLECHPEGDVALEAIVAAFEEAAADPPPTRTGQGGELCLLAVPDGAAGARFLELAREALPDTPLLPVSGGDDILLYREALQVPLSRLPQVGPAGREAYERLTAVQHFTPHTRTDIVFRRLL